MDKRTVVSKILKKGVLPNIILDRLPVMKCVEQVVEAGIEAMEISCRRPDVLSMVSEIKQEFPDLALCVSSLIEEGNMRNTIIKGGHPIPSFQDVVDAGTDALVSILPFRQATYDKFSKTHVIIPGVSIISEAQQGLDWGANIIKFSNTKVYGGASFFKGIEAATHKAIPYIVTGGMRPDIIPDYIAGNVLCFIAGFDIIIEDDYKKMQDDFKGKILFEALQRYIAAVEKGRAESQPDIPFENGDIDAVISASGRCLNV